MRACSRAFSVNFLRNWYALLLAACLIFGMPCQGVAGEDASASRLLPVGAKGTTATVQPANAKVTEYLGAAPFANTRRAPGRKSEGQPKNSALLWGRVLLYLCVLGGLLWGALYAAKRLLPGGRQLFSTPGVEVLGRTHLDSRRYIALVRVGGRVLVVGVGPDEMTALSEIVAHDEVTDLLGAVKAKAPSGPGLFQRIFQKELSETEAQGAVTEVASMASDLELRLGTLQARVKALRDTE